MKRDRLGWSGTIEVNMAWAIPGALTSFHLPHHHITMFRFVPQPGRRFDREYRCYPMSFFAASQQRSIDTLEHGDKIIMPQSALHILTQLEIMWPMMFKLCGVYQQRAVHCGVLEFSGEEGVCYVPSWMMQDLQLQQGDIVRLISATIPKGTHVTLQPKSSDFLKITNPRAVLEKSLRSFSALTKGETIRIPFNKKQYDLVVTEVGADGPVPDDGISIIETDVIVDFAEPADMTPAKPGSGKPPGANRKAGPYPVYDEDDPAPSSSSSDDEGGTHVSSKHRAKAGSVTSSGSSKAVYAGPGYTLKGAPSTPTGPSPSKSPGGPALSKVEPVASPLQDSSDHFTKLTGGQKLRK